MQSRLWRQSQTAALQTVSFFFSNATVIIAHMLLLWHQTCWGALWLVSKWVDFVVSKLHKEEKQLYPSVTRAVLAAVWLLLVIENFVIKIIIREVNFFANWRSTPYCASCYSPSPSCWGATPSSCFLLPWFLKGSWICKCNPWMSWTLFLLLASGIDRNLGEPVDMQD